MAMTHHLHRFAGGSGRVAMVAGAVVIGATMVVAQDAQAPAKTVPTVAVAVLRPLLPAATGWTTERSGASQVELSDTCAYPVADATYTHNGMRIKLKLVDSGRNPDSLMAIATMVMTLPEDYSDDMPPATTLRRLLYKGAQAAERWDAEKGEGDITLVVDGRFIVQAEGTHLDSLDTLRTVVDLVDLKKLAELK
jgi:hypothetical protein